MFCSSEAAVDMDSGRGDIRRLKDGPILKYTSGFFSSKWKTMHAVLFSDSRLVWFEQKHCSNPFIIPLPVIFFFFRSNTRSKVHSNPVKKKLQSAGEHSRRV
uniref:PH domain-containing protein n=1 Tax=Caenorhabditis tropicalis TaxID=1561998 RepID=A0A1I7UAV6_9PELO